MREPSDLPGCVAALREAHAVDTYPMTWPADPGAWLTPAATMRAWVGRVEGSVAGHVALVDDDDRVAVSRLFVRPAAQGRGLAAALLARATAHVARLGRPSGLDVVEDSGAAIRLYERLGWTLVATEPAPFLRPDGTRPVQYRYAAP